MYQVFRKDNRANGSNIVSQESYVYDSFGNVTSKSIRPYSSGLALTCAYTYSPDGSVMTESTDEYGRKTRYEYDDVTGRLDRTINYKNQVTSFEYDNMGNLVKTLYPDNVVETTTIAWNTSAPQSLFTITKSSPLAPTTRTHYSAFGKAVRESMMQFDGTMTHTDTYYNWNGILEKTSLPFVGTSATLWNTYTYDAYGRPTRVQYASGKTDTWYYSGMSVTETKEGLSTTRTMDATGKLAQVKDVNGTISYTYLLNDKVGTISLSSDLQTSFEYNAYGQQTSMNDPSLGLVKFRYDSNGYLTGRIDGNGLDNSQTQDIHGKTTTLYKDSKFEYNYNADKLLSSIKGSNDADFDYTYDAFGNVLTEKETGMDGKWLQKSYSYTDGRVMSTTYQSNSEVIGTESYTYANGHLRTVKWGNEVIWDLLEVNAFGLPTKVKTGEVTRTYTYDAFGYPTGRKATSVAGGTLMDCAYEFDVASGNLNSRTDVKRNLTESFTYDSDLGILINEQLTSIAQWNGKGNILGKSDAGLMDYDKYKIKSANTADLNPIQFPFAVPTSKQEVTYSRIMRPKTIKENGYEATLSYNANDQRIKMEVKKDSAAFLTRHYLGNVYEMDETLGSVKEKLYLGGGYYDASAVYVKQSGVWQMNYLCRDYLGSVTHITDAAGSLLAEYSYDAWGRLRNPADQIVYAPATEPELLLGRGYTGHEHLSFFGLINMNARLYDPVLGRFLSPDPYVQLPDNSLSYNRYAYALNNPLRYVDRNGEFIEIIAAVVIGAYLGGSAINGSFNPGQWDYGSWQTYAGVVVGGVAGYAGAAVGAGVASAAAAGGASAVGAGVAGGMAGGMTAGAINGAGMTAINGGSFSDIMGGMTSGMVMGGFGGALSGGVGAAIGNFSGVPGGAFENGMYEIGHSALKGGATGLASGAMMAAMTQDASYLWKGAAMGAALSVSMAGIRIGALGTAFVPGAEYGELENFGQVYRRGSIFMPKYGGITLGRNVSVGLTDDDLVYDRYLMQHETGHSFQIDKMGIFRFYARTAWNYLIKPGFSATYTTLGTLEYAADGYAFDRLGYYFKIGGVYRNTFP